MINDIEKRMNMKQVKKWKVKDCDELPKRTLMLNDYLDESMIHFQSPNVYEVSANIFYLVKAGIKKVCRGIVNGKYQVMKIKLLKEDL